MISGCCLCVNISTKRKKTETFCACRPKVENCLRYTVHRLEVKEDVTINLIYYNATIIDSVVKVVDSKSFFVFRTG